MVDSGDLPDIKSDEFSTDSSDSSLLAQRWTDIAGHILADPNMFAGRMDRIPNPALRKGLMEAATVFERLLGSNPDQLSESLTEIDAPRFLKNVFGDISDLRLTQANAPIVLETLVFLSSNDNILPRTKDLILSRLQGMSTEDAADHYGFKSAVVVSHTLHNYALHIKDNYSQAEAAAILQRRLQGLPFPRSLTKRPKRKAAKPRANPAVKPKQKIVLERKPAPEPVSDELVEQTIEAVQEVEVEVNVADNVKETPVASKPEPQAKTVPKPKPKPAPRKPRQPRAPRPLPLYQSPTDPERFDNRKDLMRLDESSDHEILELGQIVEVFSRILNFDQRKKAALTQLLQPDVKFDRSITDQEVQEVVGEVRDFIRDNFARLRGNPLLALKRTQLVALYKILGWNEQQPDQDIIFQDFTYLRDYARTRNERDYDKETDATDAFNILALASQKVFDRENT